MRKRFRRALLATGVLAVGLGAVVAFAGATTPPPKSGNDITPTFAEGSSVYADCTTVPTGQEHIFGLKVGKTGDVSNYNGTFDQSSASATHGSSNPLRVTISNAKVTNGVATFDWSANMPVDYVFVKAGNGANKYDYSAFTWGDHPATGPWGDTGLVSPKDSISHLLFCTVKKLRVEKTVVPSYTREYTWTIDKKVKTTGSFGESAALSLAAGGSGPADWRITVDQTGSKDSNIKLTGVITVLDSSPFDVTGVLDESLSNVTFSGSCAKNGSTTDQATFSVAKGKTITCPYSAPVATTADGVNTVVADPTTPNWMASTTASKAYSLRRSYQRAQQDRELAGHERQGQGRDHRRRHDRLRDHEHVRCEPQGDQHRQPLRRRKGQGCARHRYRDARRHVQRAEAADGDEDGNALVHPNVRLEGDKDRQPLSISLEDGATASSTWTVALEQDGAPVDSGWRLAGTISVTNPNGFAVNGVSVNDGLGGTVTCPSSTIAANASITCTYAVDRESGASGTNTATATTTTSGVGAGSGAAQYAFTAPTRTVNETVDVVDTNGKTWNDKTAGFTAF